MRLCPFQGFIHSYPLLRDFFFSDIAAHKLLSFLLVTPVTHWFNKLYLDGIPSLCLWSVPSLEQETCLFIWTWVKCLLERSGNFKAHWKAGDLDVFFPPSTWKNVAESGPQAKLVTGIHNDISLERVWHQQSHYSSNSILKDNCGQESLSGSEWHQLYLDMDIDEGREHVFGYKCSEAELVALSSMVFLSPPSLPPSILPSSLSCCVYASNLYPLAMSLTVYRISQWQQKQAGRSILNLRKKNLELEIRWLGLEPCFHSSCSFVPLGKALLFVCVFFFCCHIDDCRSLSCHSYHTHM